MTSVFPNFQVHHLFISGRLGEEFFGFGSKPGAPKDCQVDLPGNLQYSFNFMGQVPRIVWFESPPHHATSIDFLMCAPTQVSNDRVVVLLE